jgi:DNA end-binding protein Ku
MPRAIWSGSISFGLVNIPVKLYSAVSRKTVHFNQLDSRTGARVKQKRVDSETGEEVPYDQIVKGYELASGAYVTVTDDEMAALDPKAVRTIDIEEFVDLASIDPMFYDAAYYLVPDKSSKPYALLARAMEEEGKVGIANFVMRTKQYLAAVRPQDGRLVLSTMVYADEVNDPASIPDLADIGDIEVSDRELTMATQLIESLSADFEPERFHDTYRESVLDLIEQKASGAEVVVAPAAAEPERVVDLMAALEASVAAAKESRKRHPTAHEADEAGDAEGKPAARRRKKAS